MGKAPVPLPMLGGGAHLSEAGWTMRFVTDVRRADEMAAVYRSLGFEVISQSVVSASGPDGCDVCFTSEYRTLYTRPVASSPTEEE